MSFERDRRRGATNEKTSDAASVAPGKSTRTSKLAPVLRKAAGPASDGGAREVYASATSGASTEVPYRAEMEQSFGADFSGVQAYMGRSAEMASLGAHAATQGADGRIAFASASPSKETVAHELAHVQQARNGTSSSAVQARSDVSQPGDTAERQADAAAARVARGQSVDPSELTANASGVQRQDVTMSAGAGQTETESTTRVIDQGSQFEDQPDAWQLLLAWKNGQSTTFIRNGASVTRKPTDADALFFFYHLTPNQRNDIWRGTDGVLQHIFARFTKDDAARVMELCDFPLRWKIIHWFRDISSAGGGRDLVRTMISNSPLGQRLDAVKDETAVGLMVTTFAEDHPENLFGDAIRTQLYPDEATMATFDAAHPTFAAWRNKNQKLDAEQRWALVGQSPAANIATLKSQTAMGGRTKWTSLIHWGPRGQALSPTMRENIDKAALDSGIDAADRPELFHTRWNVTLTDPGAPYDKFKAVWVNLQRMPLGTISSDTVKAVELRINTSGGAYTDYPTSSGFGDIWVGTNTSLAYVGHTVRHEIGHGADTKLGGFANFSSKPPIVWKKWMTRQPWLQEILRYMDAPTSGAEGSACLQLLQAATSGTAFASPFGAFTAPSGGGALTPDQERQKLWDKVAKEFNAGGLTKALDALKTAGKHTATSTAVTRIINDAQAENYPTSEPAYVRDHYFLVKYGEHYSYHKQGGKEVWSNAKLRDYTLCSPYEYFADMFAAYFETDTNREANVPAWAAGYFKQLESMYDNAATEDPNNRRSTSYGNGQAPQVP